MAARDDDKAMDGLLRRSLARDTTAPADCPDADILAAYCERTLDADELAGYELHFAQCSRCREQLAAMVRAESAIEVPANELVAAVVAAPTAPRAQVHRPLATSPLEPPHSWWHGWRLLVPAAAIVIFALVMYVRVTLRETTPFLSNNEVAVSKNVTPPLPAAPQELSAPPPQPQDQKQLPANPPASRKAHAAVPPPPPSGVPAAPAPRPAAAPPPPPARTNGSPSALAAPRAPGVSGGRFVGGAAVRNNIGAARGFTAGHAATATAAKPTGQQAANSAPAARESVDAEAADQRVAQASPAPQQSEASDSTAQRTQSSAAREQVKAQESAGGAVPSPAVTQAIEVTGQTSTVVIREGVGSLFRITPQGGVERSTDGGATWKLEHLKTNSVIVAASAPSGNVCWLVGHDGIILLTRNGKSWKQVASPATIDLIAVSAEDANTARVTAIDGRIFSTQDGGKTWQDVK